MAVGLDELGAALCADAVTAARALLGCSLRANGVTLRLVETEAYAGVGQDPGSHAHRGRTPRNGSMFGPPGTAYVYFTYGMHWCLNVACLPAGEGSAVLLRAGAVMDGWDVVRSRRPGVRDRDLARGPARLTRALAVDRAADGTSMLDGRGPVTLAPGEPVDPALVGTGPRVGVGGGGAATPWRFWIDGDPAVSAYRPAVARKRR
jgi:DNA-3-methyladenine glycosylase